MSGDAPAPAQAEVSPVPPAMPGVSVAKIAPPALPRAAIRSPSAGAAASGSLQSRSTITQDIFAMKVDFYPQDHEANVVAEAVTPTSQPVDANLVRAATIQAKAKTLTLQSTMISAKPKAIINGQLVGLADTIQGFKVVEVTARSCTLVQDGVQIQLDMKDE
jgi:hypothetical protein